MICRARAGIEDLHGCRGLIIDYRVKIINKREYALAELNAENETFLMHIATLLELITMPIYLIYKAEVTSLISKETGILIEYSDFSNIFFQTPRQSY